MSPTILAELLAVRRTLSTRYATKQLGDSEHGWTVMELNHVRLQLLRHEARISKGERYDVVKVFVRSLPCRRYDEESWREHEAEMAAGGRTVCPECGERSVPSGRSVVTLGYAGHPGAEYSAFYVCERESCDYADLA